jgi:hypothetical protein
MPSSKTKKSKSKKRRLEDPAAAYTEDLGTQGVKVSLSDKSGTGIFSSPLAEDEDQRRAKRMVRVEAIQCELDAETSCLLRSL